MGEYLCTFCGTMRFVISNLKEMAFNPFDNNPGIIRGSPLINSSEKANKVKLNGQIHEVRHSHKLVGEFFSIL